MEPYQYSPLWKYRNEIRLMTLLPGPASADLEIEIFHAERSARYEALSYVWGSLERTDVALVSKPAQIEKPLSQLLARLRIGSNSRTTLGITRNLAVALHHLRHSEKPRVLWIDAICINQDDLEERSAEVLEMGSIYADAQEVIVWLGPSSKDSPLAIKTLRKLAEGINPRSEDGTLYHKPDSWAELLYRNSEALVANAPGWFAIKDLLHRQWFSRLWVYQEALQAKSATVIVGNDSIDWDLFIAAVTWIMANLVELKVLFDDFKTEDFTQSSINGFLKIPSAYLKRRGGVELDILLEHTSRMNCLDPRDRLYAIRSLAIPEVRRLIIPDYGISVEEAFKDFTVRLIDTYPNGVNILARCLLRKPPSTLRIPSWVPDFSSTTETMSSSGLRASGDSQFFGVVTNESLSLQGVKLATVTTLMSPIQPHSTYTQIIETCRSWEASCESSLYPGGGSTANAFVDAILGGWMRESFPNPRHGALLTVEQCRQALESYGEEFEGNVEELAIRLGEMVRKRVRRRCFFKTREGFFGLCPESARAGDLVVVGLGVYSPLVLRPVTHEGKSCCLVVGATYVPGVMNAEVLFGSLPLGWNLSRRGSGASGRLVFTHGDIVTQEDPRVALQPQWRYRYIPQGDESKTPKELLLFVFENVETNETSIYDPRLTPEALRERGINLEEFILV